MRTAEYVVLTLCPPGPLEHRLDDQLGRRPRNQHGRRDFEVEPPEFARPDDVGERLTGNPARHQRLVVPGKPVGFSRLRLGEKPFRRPAENVLREQPRVELGV